MAKSIMNKKVLANKIIALEQVLESKTATEEEKEIARTEMDEFLSKIGKLPGGLTLLMQVNSIIEKELTKAKI